YTYTYNMFNQGKNVVLMNVGWGNGVVSTFKFDSKTGTGGTEIDRSYNFIGLYSVLVLPTKNDKYLNFGDFPSSGGFNDAVDYFDDSTEITLVTANTFGLTNNILGACVIGNYVYTTAVRIQSKYSDSTGNRGVLWINKYNTDFLNNSVGVKELSFQNAELKIYPNPATSELNIQTNSTEKMNVQLFDITGKEMIENISFTNSVTINTQTFSQGIYFLKITDANSGMIKIQKVAVGQ
ncbi:MAG: T9SS type A sorting domain-containing protein, partial [Bacteroidia bacterium]